MLGQSSSGHCPALSHQVQRIKNEFTVQVYELHARMALESVRMPFVDVWTKSTLLSVQSDMVEYNQCQATLRTLYELGIPGKVEEFTAYRILLLLHGRNRSGSSYLAGVVMTIFLTIIHQQN